MNKMKFRHSNFCINHNHYLVYAQQQQMEKGFTGNETKGLFTFYREQNQLQKGKDKLHLTTIKGSNVVKKHYVSLSNYNNLSYQQKPSPTQQSNKPKPPPSQRYNQVREQLQVKQTFTPKNVLTINFRNSRKNEFYFQLISSKARRNRTEIQSYFKQKISSKIKETNLLKNLSVREIPANQVKQMFKPKKQCLAKLHNIRKKPMKISAISAHCINEGTTNNFQDQKIFRVPVLKSAQPNKNKNKIELSNIVFKEAMQLRRHRLQSNTFWQQIKQKRPKREVNIINLNNKIQQWTKLEALRASHGTTIQQLLKK